jgi:Arc/MetJ-type ribon-helix-helix transcriptional regulator
MKQETETLVQELRDAVDKPEYRNRLGAIRAKLQTVPVAIGESAKWDSHHDHTDHTDNNDGGWIARSSNLLSTLKGSIQAKKQSNEEIDQHTDYTDHMDFSDTGTS